MNIIPTKAKNEQKKKWIMVVSIYTVLYKNLSFQDKLPISLFEFKIILR